MVNFVLGGNLLIIYLYGQKYEEAIIIEHYSSATIV